MNTLATTLRKLRIDKTLPQEPAADKLGVSPQAVSRWETATTLPDVMLLPEIAKLYDVLVDDRIPVDYLVRGTPHAILESGFLDARPVQAQA